MRWKGFVGAFVVALFVFTGCAKRIPVSYDQVEKDNSVEVTLVSGKKVEGTIVKVEPHQLTLTSNQGSREVVPKSSIRSVKRKPPVYDDFGRCISEEEIRSVQTGRNTVVYGIGGGVLSFGASFFAGSLVANSMEKSGSTALTVTTGVGGSLGTALFVKAGKAKDRREAIKKIRDKRRSVEVKEEQDETSDQLRRTLEEEKKKQEALRKEREELLKQLEETQKD